MGPDTDLLAALRRVTRKLTLRQLGRKGVGSVRVIERGQFLELLAQAEARGAAREARGAPRAVEPQPSGEQRALDHPKDLLEAQRSRLRAHLDSIDRRA